MLCRINIDLYLYLRVSPSFVIIELDVEDLMQCAREAETSCDRPATPIPAWTTDAQVPIYYVLCGKVICYSPSNVVACREN